MSVFYPADPTAMPNARNAQFFTRIGNWHSSEQLRSAFEATPSVKQTFCCSVNNVILVFSATLNGHHDHVRAILEMLRARSMRANLQDCVFDANRSVDAGVRLEPVGAEGKLFMVVNEGRPGSSAAQ